MSYVKNTFYVGVSKLIENVISYLIIVMISRSLGASGLGQYSFIFSFVGLFFIFSDWGLGSMLIKDLSKDFSKVDKYVSNVFIFTGILSVISFFVYFVSLFFIGKNEILIPLILVGVIQLTNFLNGVPVSILRIKNAGKILALSQFLERFIALIGGFISLIIFNSLSLFVLVLLLSNLVKTIVQAIYSKKYFKLNFNLDFKFIKKLIIQGWPFILIGTFLLIYVRMDSVMLSFMKGDSVVGWYNAPYKLINILNVFPSLLMTFGFPTFSRLFSKSRDQLKSLFTTIIYYCNLIIFPIVVGVWFVGDRVLEFIYGFGSYESFIAFRILIIAQMFVFLTGIMGQLIAAADKQKVFALIGGIGAFVNIVLNLILIGPYSLYGAGVATLVTYFLMFVLMYIYIFKNFFKFKIKVLVPLVGSILMGLVLANILHLHLILIILISGIVYSFVFVLFELITNKIKNIIN